MAHQSCLSPPTMQLRIGNIIRSSTTARLWKYTRRSPLCLALADRIRRFDARRRGRVSAWVVAYSDIKCPSLAFGEASNALTPNRCRETDSHAIPQAFVLPSHWCHPWSSCCRTQCPPAFLSFCSFFLSLCLSPAFHKEISRLDRLETTIANSVDPLHPRYCPLLMRISLSQSRSLSTSDCLQGHLALL